MCNKMILTTMALFCFLNVKIGWIQVSGTLRRNLELLMSIESGTKRTAINVIVFKNCFYKQRIKLPQLQSMYFLLSSGGHWRNCVVLYGYCYVFSWLGGVAVARGLKFLRTNSRYRSVKSYLYYK